MSAPAEFSLVVLQRRAIVAALRQTLGDKNGAAWLLGIGKATLYRKLRSLEIEPGEYMYMAANAEGA